MYTFLWGPLKMSVQLWMATKQTCNLRTGTVLLIIKPPPPLRFKILDFDQISRKWLLLFQLFFGQNWGILANFGALKWSILKRFPLSIDQKSPIFFRALRAQSRRVAFIIPTFFWISAKVAFIDGGVFIIKRTVVFWNFSCLSEKLCRIWKYKKKSGVICYVRQ